MIEFGFIAICGVCIAIHEWGNRRSEKKHIANQVAFAKIKEYGLFDKYQYYVTNTPGPNIGRADEFIDWYKNEFLKPD